MKYALTITFTLLFFSTASLADIVDKAGAGRNLTELTPVKCMDSGKYGYAEVSLCPDLSGEVDARVWLRLFGEISEDGDAYIDTTRLFALSRLSERARAISLVHFLNRCPSAEYDSEKKELFFSRAARLVLDCQFDSADYFWLMYETKDITAEVWVGGKVGEINMKGEYVERLHEPPAPSRYKYSRL